MKKLIFLLFVLAGTALAQLGRFDGSVLPTGTPNGPANVAVCQLNGSAGPPCSPLAVIYDQSGAPDTNPFSADMNGRYNFYAQPGTYIVQTYGTGYTTTATTVAISVPGSAPGVNPAAVVGPVFNPMNYGAKGDARSVIDGVTSNGSATVTSATANWSAADVGKVFWCVKVSNGNTSTASSLRGDSTASGLSTIVSVQSASSITISNNANAQAGSGQNCVWGTDDTVAITAASAAAIAGTTNFLPHNGQHLANQGTVYIPQGAYIVSSNIMSFVAASRYSQAPNFLGAGVSSTMLYVAPTYTLATAPLIQYSNAADFQLGNFSIWGSGAFDQGLSGGSLGLISLGDGTNGKLADRAIVWPIEVDDIGLSQTNDAILFTAGRNITYYSPYIQQGPPNDLALAMYFISSDGIHIINPSLSNHFQNLVANNSGVRDGTHLNFAVEGGFIDECGAGAGKACTLITANSQVAFSGTGIFGGNGALTLEIANGSYARLSEADAGPFAQNSNLSGVQVDAGGTLIASETTFRALGSGIDIVNNGTYYDVGGNTYLNCVNSGGACSAATIAQSFSGTQPIESLTHSATNPFIPTDTAQTWMQMTPDQPIRVTRIQVTPANGSSVSCTVTPVFQITNGTTTQTQNIANATATDDSGAITTGNTYVAGTAITFGISAAGTCTTAPANMNVNVLWQAVAPSQ